MIEDGAEAAEYRVAHTMLRIKEPERSLRFYQTVLGMVLVKRADYREWRFTVYFLAPGYLARNRPKNQVELTQWMFEQSGLIELTHNWGTEADPLLQMHNGNEAPQGFGHICLAVPNIRAACRRFERLGVAFHKRLGEGAMKEIAFIKDPDGYLYEIVQADLLGSVLNDVPSNI
jgi:lactoylglutathione lyase